MSHPLVVEALETLFVPVAVFNNTEGDADAKVRDSFQEPAWNNPVLRVLTMEGRDAIPRLDRHWTVGELASGLARARSACHLSVPLWLSHLSLEPRGPREIETAIFGMT